MGLWLTNLEEWNKLSLKSKLDALRKYYCTGACGQSSSVLKTREITDKVLKEAIESLEQKDKVKL